MGARQKLNEVYVTGSLAVATAAGLAPSSWATFLATLALLLGMGCVGRAIAP